jgi:hypothetical protein
MILFALCFLFSFSLFSAEVPDQALLTEEFFSEGSGNEERAKEKRIKDTWDQEKGGEGTVRKAQLFAAAVKKGYSDSVRAFSAAYEDCAVLPEARAETMVRDRPFIVWLIKGSFFPGRHDKGYLKKLIDDLNERLSSRASDDEPLRKAKAAACVAMLPNKDSAEIVNKLCGESFYSRACGEIFLSKNQGSIAI